eukprot:621184-Pyramimonas_sp.AAC.1
MVEGSYTGMFCGRSFTTRPCHGVAVALEAYTDSISHEGLLRRHNPEEHELTSFQTSRHLGVPAQDDPVLLYPAVWDDPSIPKPPEPEPSEVSGPGAQPPEAHRPAALAPEPDYWERA